MEEILTRKEFDKMLGTLPVPAFNEIWCSTNGLKKIKELILIEGSPVYKTIDYLSFIVTPIKIMEYISDDEAFLMKKVANTRFGVTVPESVMLVGKVNLK